MIVFLVVSIICALCGAFTIMQIPVPQNVFFEIVWVVGILILVLVTILISFCIGGFVSSPIWSKNNFDYYDSRSKIFSEACARLREYYGLQEPCLVTKCYESSDKKFTNHDVCIFIVGDELRITVNLKHGFSRPEHDLGCYAFKAEEILLSEKQGEQYLMAELKVDNMEFLLGHRAKRFIERNFLETKAMIIK